MELREEIGLLIDLQKLDTEIFALNKRKTGIPLLIKNTEEKIKLEEAKIKEVEDGFKQLTVKQKDKENDLRTKEETIKKHQSQLFQIKTNKEYTALQQEIEGVKADKSVLEDEIIVLLDEIEEGKKKVDEAKGKIKAEEDKINEEKKKFEVELKEIETKLTDLESKRKELSGKVDKNTVSKYERILHGKDGSAMVPVQHDSCGGCHLNLPPQVINEIRMKKELIFCESCARILYIEE